MNDRLLNMDSENISQINEINDELTETQKILQELFKDPLLSDLTKTNTPESLTIEEVDTLIALELGTAFEIIIERGLFEPLGKTSINFIFLKKKTSNLFN